MVKELNSGAFLVFKESAKEPKNKLQVRNGKTQADTPRGTADWSNEIRQLNLNLKIWKSLAVLWKKKVIWHNYTQPKRELRTGPENGLLFNIICYEVEMTRGAMAGTWTLVQRQFSVRCKALQHTVRLLGMGQTNKETEIMGQKKKISEPLSLSRWERGKTQNIKRHHGTRIDNPSEVTEWGD